MQAKAPSMTESIERNLGEQPILELLKKHALKAHDLVATSPGMITHKMISRACKGRRLTPNVQVKILQALNQASRETYKLENLFNYGSHTRKKDAS
jgi:hypothetical protein